MNRDPFEFADDLIEDWHTLSSCPIYVYMKLSLSEYVAFVQDCVLPEDFIERHFNVTSSPGGPPVPETPG